MDLGSLATDLGLVTLIGGALGLDRRGAFQTMVSQPLVVVPILGLLLGQLPDALWLGAVLQLLWMSSLLVGASVPPNETIASVVIGGTVLVYGRHFGEVDVALKALAILLCAPLSLVGRWMDIRQDRENLVLAAKADEAARAAAPQALARLPAIGLLRTFVASAVLVGPSLVIGLALLRVLRPQLGGALLHTFQVLGTYVIPSLGLAVAMSTVRRRRALALTGVSFLLVMGLSRYWTVP